MIDTAWLVTHPADLAAMALSAIVIYIALMVCTRLAGLRSFSKLSSFDFAITVALGTILASTLLTPSPALGTGIAALVLLFVIQGLVAWARRHSYRIERLVGNEPLLLMAGREPIAANLDKARVSLDDLRAKLRQAGITQRDQVRCVVMESTGDISVLVNDTPLDPWLVDHVRDGEQALDR